MLETTISLLAMVCSLCVAAVGLFRWQRNDGYKSSIYLALGAFAGLVALLNLSALMATDGTFVQTATAAYVGFATAITLPAARALANLTYEKPEQDKGEDAAI